MNSILHILRLTQMHQGELDVLTSAPVDQVTTQIMPCQLQILIQRAIYAHRDTDVKGTLFTFLNTERITTMVLLSFQVSLI